MNKMTKLLAPVLSLTLLTGVFIALQGCEKDKNTNDNGDLDTFFEGHPYVSDPRDSRDRILSLTPPSASITEHGQTAVFTVEGGSPPFTWYAARTDIGTAAAQGERQGRYTADLVAQNTVIVADPNGNAAIATITASGGSLAITPGSATLMDGEHVTLTASGGTPPYQWSLAFATGDFGPGPIITATGTIVTYYRRAAGKNVIKLMDSNNNIVSMEVQQPTVTPLAIIPPGPIDLSWGETLQFNGSGGTPPYFYTVQFTGRGTITSTGWYAATTNTAVHTSNQVTVWDSAGGTRSATVNLPP